MVSPSSIAALLVAVGMSFDPLGAGIFFRNEREIQKHFAPCEKVSDDPVTLRCGLKLRSRPGDAIFVFDETHRVNAVVVAFLPYNDLDEAQQLLKAVAGTLSGQFGPPKAQRSEAGVVWSWSNDHGSGEVKVTKTDDGRWLVSASLKEGHLPDRFTQ